MVDTLKYPREKPGFLLLGSAEDVSSVPQHPEFDIILHHLDKGQVMPRIIGIISDDPTVIEDKIRRVRQDSGLALLPLVVFSSIKSPYSAMADGIYPPAFDPQILLGILRKWEPMRGEIDKFSSLSPNLARRERNRIILLRYLILRGVSQLEPMRDIHSATGYSYPIARLILNAAPYDECEADLKIMEDRGFLESEFVDTVHLCCGCGSFHLNFRETCPRCKSANLAEERNIHHFRCGHVGCEGEFHDMRCPKCRRQLKHIGVDYELPSVSFRCLGCHEGFGDPLVACLCIKCGKDFPVENAIKRIIRSYVLTPEGKRYAGDGHQESSVKSELGLLEFGVFKEFFTVQTAIAERAGKNFSLILVRGEFSGPSGRLESNTTSDSARQLVTVMKKTLRGQDIMTAHPAGGILALVPATSEDKAICIAGRIESAFAGNPGNSLQPTVTYYEYNGIPFEDAIDKLYATEKMAGDFHPIHINGS